MRLWELFDNLEEKSLSSVEKELDTTAYQPPAKVAKDKPVIDLDLLSSKHFSDRFVQRSQSAGITATEIEDVLRRGRERYKQEIGAASKQTSYSGEQVDIFDPETKILIPTLVQPNPNCKPNTSGNFTCDTVSGRQPKNRLVAKTVMRKGTPD